MTVLCSLLSPIAWSYPQPTPRWLTFIADTSSNASKPSISLPDDPRSVLLDFPVEFDDADYFLDPNNPLRRGLPPIPQFLDPDYGDLHVASLRLRKNFVRRISPDRDVSVYNEERLNFLQAIDDAEMDEYFYSYEDRLVDPKGCVRPKWTYNIYPNCNSFHELYLELLPGKPEQDYEVLYLAHGYYRESYRFRPKRHDDKPFVLKHLRLSDNLKYDYWFFASMRSEALVMERLSGSTRTSDIYGFCAMSTMVEEGRELTYKIVPESQEERGRMSQQDLDQLQSTVGDVYPVNTDLTTYDKLVLAITIAEALAEMHGYASGCLIMDDVHPDQWLISSDKRAILNDLNNAVVLDWHMTEQRYCQFHVSYVFAHRTCPCFVFSANTFSFFFMPP
jgi:hypothetical protein